MAEAEQVIDLAVEREKRILSRVPETEAEYRTWLDGLMREYGDKLARFFSFKTSDPEAARDLVIETFYRAWKSRKSFRGEAKPSTWLWTIARRTLAAFYEKRSRSSAEVLVDVVPETASADESRRANLRGALVTCVSALSERVQKSVELVWVQGHTFVEAAELMEESADSVRMRLKRARGPLQECLKGRGVLA